MNPRNAGLAALTPHDLATDEQDAVVALAIAILKHRHRRGRALSSTQDTRAYLRLRLAERQGEVFGALFLDTRHRVLELAELFQGTVNAANVYPRIVVQRALELNAAAIILFHNHPSGVAEPSPSDEAITRHLKEALALIDVRVLDHFVVTAGESVSFSERGLL